MKIIIELITNHEYRENFWLSKSLGVTQYPKYSAKIKEMLIYTKEKSYLKQLIVYLDGKTLGNDMNFRILKKILPFFTNTYLDW